MQRAKLKDPIIFNTQRTDGWSFPMNIEVVTDYNGGDRAVDEDMLITKFCTCFEVLKVYMSHERFKSLNCKEEMYSCINLKSGFQLIGCLNRLAFTGVTDAF